MRFDTVRPGGVWAPEMVPGASDYGRLDITQSKSVNGDLGGTYTPSRPIVIGGQGVTVGTLVSPATSIGGAATATGGRIQIAVAAGDFPTLSPTRTRTITVPVLNFYTLGGAGAPFAAYDDAHGFGVRVPAGAGLVPAYWELSDSRTYLHAGARLASASLDFVITKKPSALPANALQMAISSTNDTGALLAGAQLNPTAFVDLVAWNSPYTPVGGSYVIASTDAKNPKNALDASGLYFKCITSGAVGGAEPTWPTTVGATVNDGSAVWQCIGRNGTVALKGATLDSYYNNGAPQTVSWDYDGTSGLGGTSNIISLAQRYQMLATYFDGINGMSVTGITLTFDTIGALSFE